LLDELRAIQNFGALKALYKPVIFLGGFFSEAAFTASEVAANKEALAKLGNTHLTQRHIISAFEWLCGSRFPSLLRYFPAFLKHLYEEDLVEEEVFLSWNADYPRNEFSVDESLLSDEILEELRSKASPFITWLQEAEEDEEDEEEDDDEDA
jgi:translation initiation factor 5